MMVHVHSTLGFGENEQCPKPVFYSLRVEHCTFCKAKKKHALYNSSNERNNRSLQGETKVLGT